MFLEVKSLYLVLPRVFQSEMTTAVSYSDTFEGIKPVKYADRTEQLFRENWYLLVVKIDVSHTKKKTISRTF